MQTLSAETTNLVEGILRAKLERNRSRRPVTESQVCEAMRMLLAKIDRLESERADGRRSRDEFTWPRALNGAMAIHGQAIYADTAESDAEMVKAFSDITTPGQFLVPVMQADSFVNMLSLGSTMRRAGATIWPMSGIEELRIPVGLTSPQFLFMAQNSRQSPDPNFNLAQVSLTLKELRALVPVPWSLFKSARPALESLLPTFFSFGAGEAESLAFHATATLNVDSPLALMSAAGVTFVNCANSANGGAIAVSDVLGLMQKAAELKLRFPWAFFCSPRTWNRLFSLQSASSMLWLGPPETLGGEWTLCGWPLYLDTAISNSEALGSGSAQSHLVLCSPPNIAIGQDNALAFAVSTDFGLDTGDINVRLIHHVDIDYQPRAGFVILRGIN